MNAYAYPGAELDLFRHAVRWKRYYANEIGPCIRGAVLEVGAGVGATSRFLCDARHASGTSLEPDSTLAQRLSDDVAARPLPAPAIVRQGTVRSLPAQPLFDTALYIEAIARHVGPSHVRLVRAFYLDSVGMLASLANRLLLRAAYPTEAQIRFWDSRLVPASHVIDRLTRQRLGKTVIALWKKG